MKMSDVFNLPVMQDKYGMIDSKGADLGCIYNGLCETYAVHAINQHDKLVELNKELVTTLEFQLGNDYIHRKTKDEIRYQIKRAKELAE